MKYKFKLLLIVGFSAILIALGYCGYKVHTLSAQQETIKADYATVKNVSFGLLSVSQWRDQIVIIISKQIQDFDFTPQQTADLEKEIEQILNALIDKAVSMINKPQKSIGGKLKKAAFDVFVNTDDLHKQVPIFAKQIVAEVEKPSSKLRLQNIAQSKLNQLGQQTYDSSMNAEKTAIDTTYRKYNVTTAEQYESKTAMLLTSIRKTTYAYAFGMLGCVLLILFVWWLLRKQTELSATLFILSVLAAGIILYVGLTTTMIEVDARIQSLDFYLLGSSISFKNQVLFFQSKSILDVVMILLKTGKYDTEIVGALIFCFSVLFPVLKLVSASIYVSSEKKWARGKFLSYFAFKSGKWSMADVMVVAILMSYIGFNGIIESQLASLNIHTTTLSSITTNNTALQPGYIVFVLFVLFGLALSQILKNITGHAQE
jgi:hypothetical protein